MNRNRQCGDRSERLLGFGQCLAIANFSSPCGRTTVTFFRSKAERILSSDASFSLLDAPHRETCNSLEATFPAGNIHAGVSRSFYEYLREIRERLGITMRFTIIASISMSADF